MKDRFKLLSGIAAGVILVSSIYFLNPDSSIDYSEDNHTAANFGDNITAKDNNPPPTYRQYFWKSFRTRQRADGFAGTLRRNSGIDCKVKKLEEGGGYRTFFEYSDPADRQAKLEVLRESTGFASLETDN